MSALDTGRLVRHRARALLSIPLHRARVSRLRLVGIGAGVAQCPALAQKVPTLVELNLHRTQPLRISVQSIGIRTIRLLAAT